ncbi:hypothetical protein K469DRAFT_745903 [Zopfia rhizophila CBS 207.26]|uniref:FabD/lysophospholipase-like protein n=1 Tax=Zopfia rhizophila CBS 207.26 TaxID=1314779 RepID=A0A6A6EMH2_9PEZI|nr:hypothetical protein K469DRAFT_745903 [Zopfia rhizophila CBS 207.26]
MPCCGPSHTNIYFLFLLSDNLWSLTSVYLEHSPIPKAFSISWISYKSSTDAGVEDSSHFTPSLNVAFAEETTPYVVMRMGANGEGALNTGHAGNDTSQEMMLFARAVIHSETEGERLSQLHDQDKVARWFNIRHDCGRPKLSVYDRFGKLCDPRRSGNMDTANQFPSFVSFIGKSGVGKSTLVRAMILLGAINKSGLLSNSQTVESENIEDFANILASPREAPVTKSGDINHLTAPTTFGVHLYHDGRDYIRSNEDANFPILFADCEGFYAGIAVPNSERFAQRERESEGVGELQRHLLYEAEITSPTYRTQDKTGIELFYARFLYAVSDVVVFVTNDDNLMENSITSILEWAAAAVLNSMNHPSRKTLIIVRNMANDHRPELYDDKVLQGVYLKHEPRVWKGSKELQKFVTDYNSKQDLTECIYENKDLYKVLFSDIVCCCIPNKKDVDSQPEELLRQYQHLRGRIDDASRRAQLLRQKGWTQYNVPTFSHILLKAFEHFRESDKAFDFYMAARSDNPTPTGFSDHIANFLRLAFDTPFESSVMEELTQRNIALSLVTWALRNFNQVVDPELIFARGEGRKGAMSLEKLCETAFKQYEGRYQQCSFKFPGGLPCCIRPAITHTHHQSANGVRARGAFIPKRRYSPKWMSGTRQHFIEYYRALVTNDGSIKQPNHKPLRCIARARREGLLQRYYRQWGQIRSNKTCLACLQNVPENVLPCGHAYCVLCVQELGAESKDYESAWVMDHCSLCWTSQRNPHLVRLKPWFAGVRILTLDGGGIRGIVELTRLKQLNNIIDLGIPFRDFFDLIVGTSTGGIIALALGMQDESLNDMTGKFVEFATNTFSRPNAGDILTKAKIGHIMTKIFMALGFTKTMFDSTPLKRGLIDFFGEGTSLFSSARARKHQCSTGVAVVTATDAGDTKCLISSYNRPDLSDCPDFEREDDDDMSMKIWEAALATSAAPFYLPPFKKLETGKEYVDGALYANCPAETALREMKRIWPQNGASLDILLSLGAGHQKREIKVPKTVKVGGFEEICRSFHNNLDTQKLWNSFLQSDAAENVQARLRRLNPDINSERDYIALWHYHKMEKLRTMVELWMQEPRWIQEILDIADTLMANLFFFQPGDDNAVSSTTLSVDGTRALKGLAALSGTIRCRLRHNSVELKTLLKRVVSFHYAVLADDIKTHSEELPSDLQWTELMGLQSMRAQIVENKRRLRVPFILEAQKGSRVAHVLAVQMKNSGKKIPISGFPVTLDDLIRRSNSRN